MFVNAQKVRRHFKVALFGKWKTGKTRAALSFPKPAVIDTHRGTDLYDQKYDFKVLHATGWKEMEAPVTWLQKNAEKEGVETLVIDDLSTIYDDLINEVNLYRQNKSGSNAPLSHGDWGVIKRRWKSFLQMLLRLNLNVVLVIREKDEYEDTVDRDGKDVHRKTGNVLMDADRQTSYLFDFILHMYTEDDKKKKLSRHFVRVEGTRHDGLQKYSVHDITGKFMYEELFLKIRGAVNEGVEVDQEEPAKEVETPEDPLDSRSMVERNREILEKFTASISDDQPPATLEDIKVLMTRANQMKWPDGSKFSSADGKALIQGHYNIESTKELRKPQVDFLYAEFGKVLAGHAKLDRDEKGIPYIATTVDLSGGVEAGNKEVTRTF